jgi:hypothetical protein
MTLLFRFVLYLGFAEDLEFWKCRGSRKIMHNDASYAETLDWVVLQWIFMQVITEVPPQSTPRIKARLFSQHTINFKI